MIYTIPIILSFAAFGYFLTKALSPAEPASPTSEVVESFETRVLIPLWERIRRIVFAITPKGKIQRLMTKATSLNIRLDPITVIAGQVMSGFAAFIIAYQWGLLYAIIAGFIMYCLPEWIIDQMINERQTKIRLGLPAFLASIVIYIEAGHSIDQAIKTIATTKKRPIHEEFNKAQVAILNGASRKRAFEGIIQRTKVPELTATLHAVLYAIDLGADLGVTLRAQANNLRVKRRQRAEQEAAKAPVKLTVAAVFFFVAFLLVFAAIIWPDASTGMMQIIGGR